MYTPRDLIERILPYRMQSVSILNYALRCVTKWDKPKSLEIKFDGITYVEGLSTAFTNAVIEAGIMHCRAILEFLGLLADSTNHAKLKIRQTRRNDDLLIEDFTGPRGKLSKITIDEALSPYKGDRDEAERALARVIQVANKALAHQTMGPVEDLDDLKLFEIASRGVPILAINYFYSRMGLKAPDYKLPFRKREEV